MILKGDLSQNDKEIIILMSPNEGNLDSIQSYDSVALTAGAMQKTINNQGTGELSRQIWEFKQDNLALFNKYLGKCCKWSVEKTGQKSGDFWGENENYTVYYEKENGEKITGKELKDHIRINFKKDQYGKKTESLSILPIIELISSDEYQEKQIKDFKFRLDYSIANKVEGFKIKEYIKSNYGRALILDQHVNAPAWVGNDFKSSLNRFFKKKDKEIEEYNKDKKPEDQKNKISRNPNDWTDNHSTYEDEILIDYGKNRRGTDMVSRFNKIKNKSGK